MKTDESIIVVLSTKIGTERQVYKYLKGCQLYACFKGILGRGIAFLPFSGK